MRCQHCDWASATSESWSIRCQLSTRWKRHWRTSPPAKWSSPCARRSSWTRVAISSSMPAFVRSPAVHGAKLLTLIPGNSARGLPTHVATIALMDPASGALIALVDGAAITELRTAAVSAVSARYLARPDASRLAILGTGVQARGHLAFLPLVREFSHVSNLGARVPIAHAPCRLGADRHLARRRRRCRRRSVAPTSSCCDVIASANDRGCLGGSGYARRSRVGACRPTSARWTRAWWPGHTSSSIRGPPRWPSRRRGAGHPGGTVRRGARAGGARRGDAQGAGRPADRDVTIFKSLGMAVEDLVAAHLAWRRARERGVGVEIPEGQGGTRRGGESAHVDGGVAQHSGRGVDAEARGGRRRHAARSRRCGAPSAVLTVT